MFRKILDKLDRYEAEKRLNRYLKRQRHLTKIDFLKKSIRDKCIEFVTRWDIANDSLNLSPSHKVDTILPVILKTEKDITACYKRFPYKKIVAELERMEQCYGY